MKIRKSHLWWQPTRMRVLVLFITMTIAIIASNSIGSFDRSQSTIQPEQPIIKPAIIKSDRSIPEAPAEPTAIPDQSEQSDQSKQSDFSTAPSGELIDGGLINGDQSSISLNRLIRVKQLINYREPYRRDQNGQAIIDDIDPELFSNNDGRGWRLTETDFIDRLTNQLAISDYLIDALSFPQYNNARLLSVKVNANAQAKHRYIMLQLTHRPEIYRHPTNYLLFQQQTAQQWTFVGSLRRIYDKGPLPEVVEIDDKQWVVIRKMMWSAGGDGTRDDSELWYQIGSQNKQAALNNIASFEKDCSSADPDNYCFAKRYTTRLIRVYRRDNDYCIEFEYQGKIGVHPYHKPRSREINKQRRRYSYIWHQPSGKFQFDQIHSEIPESLD